MDAKPQIPHCYPTEVERRMAIETWARLILAKIAREAEAKQVQK